MSDFHLWLVIFHPLIVLSCVPLPSCINSPCLPLCDVRSSLSICFLTVLFIVWISGYRVIFCSLFMLQVQINNLDFSSSITGSFLHLHRVISGLGFCHLPRCDRSLAHGHLCWQKRQRLFLRKYFCTCLNGTWQFYSLKEATVSVQCKSH